MIQTSKKAFTLLELSLAMAFISFLLLFIGLTTAGLTNLYQRGIILSQINDNGRELVDEFTRGITASVYEDEAIEDLSDFYFEYTADLGDKVRATGAVPLYGAFCTGTYTYLWNTGYALGLSSQDISENPLYLASWENGTKSIERFRLLRVSDQGRTICNNYNNSLDDGHPTSQFTGGDSPVELLPETANDLALYDFKTSIPAYDKASKHAFYYLSFILGSVGGSVDITTGGDFCEINYGGSFVSEFTYCAVNKFNFAARATGGISYEN